MYIKRIFDYSKELAKNSILLLGPRRCGKSAWIDNELKPDRVYDLLKHEDFINLSQDPSLIRKELKSKDQLIVIDEIQKLPDLMDEVHYIIEKHKVKFLLTGSSARKMSRGKSSLMAGRAWARMICPFVSYEINLKNIDDILETGLIPAVYTSISPWDELESYVGTYLSEEIQLEARLRNIENFSRFLITAALSNGQMLNFQEIGNDAQVPPRTIREYYQLLQDTLVGQVLEPYTSKKISRKVVSTSKFYFFDLGVVHYLQKRRKLPKGTAEYGMAFEQFIFQELRAYQKYKMRDMEINYYRDYEDLEVDFILNKEIAIEVKATKHSSNRNCVNLVKLNQIAKMKKLILVTQDEREKKEGNVQVLPWKNFVEELWEGKLV